MLKAIPFPNRRFSHFLRHPFVSFLKNITNDNFKRKLRLIDYINTHRVFQSQIWGKDCGWKDNRYVLLVTFSQKVFIISNKCMAECDDFVQVDKHELVLELGVQYRDLRIVDPHVPTPYPAGIFLRDKAMVLNLESLRYNQPSSVYSFHKLV